MRVHPDTYPTRLQSFIAQTPSGVPEWHDWDDAHIPRTTRPVRFRHVVAFYWQDGTMASPRIVSIS